MHTFAEWKADYLWGWSVALTISRGKMFANLLAPMGAREARTVDGLLWLALMGYWIDLHRGGGQPNWVYIVGMHLALLSIAMKSRLWVCVSFAICLYNVLACIIDKGDVRYWGLFGLTLHAICVKDALDVPYVPEEQIV